MKKIFLKIMSMIITVPFSLFIGLSTAAGSIIIATAALFVKQKKAEKVVLWVFSWWRQSLLRTARVKLKVLGRENVPSGGCLYVFNHLSHYDIPVLLEAIPEGVKFGAKAELFKIPIFSQAMAAYGTLKIDRGNRQEAIETLSKAKSRLASGESFILAAEGTRQATPGIGEFKSGPIIFAIQAGVPIVPVVIYGTDKILPKGQLFLNFNVRKDVTLEILPPVPTVGYTVDTRDELKNKIRAMFLASYEELKKRDNFGL